MSVTHSDGSLSVCPTCGQAVERLISAPAFQFKGSGFYITDYRSENYKAGQKKDSTPATTAGGDSKTSSASESKSAPAKTETKPAKTPKATS